MTNKKSSQEYRRRSRKGDRLPDVCSGSDTLIRLGQGSGDANSLNENGRFEKPPAQQAFFLVQTSQQQVQREKEKARALRKTRWWQRQMDRGVCHYCRNAVPRDQLTLDHIVPLIRGGRSNRGNVVPACKSCNSRKKYLLPMEWEEFLRSVNSLEVGGRSPVDPSGDRHGASEN